MRRKPVELLAHVGLGGDQDRLLMQPVGIEAFGLRQAASRSARQAARGSPRAGGPAPIRRAARAPRFRRAAQSSTPRQRRAFVPAHVGERGDRFGEARVTAASAPCCSSSLSSVVADLDHAFERRASRRASAATLRSARASCADRRQHGLEHRRVDAHRGCAPLRSTVRLAWIDPRASASAARGAHRPLRSRPSPAAGAAAGRDPCR